LKVLEVIQYLHHKGIIHRDLRLPNILINANKLFVIDFGLAVFYHDKELDADASMPPEKKLYREIAYTSDFYALGHFVLFLLYSSYQPSSLKNQGWEDELTIGNQGLYIIRRLLKLDNGYENVNEIVADVEKALLTM
jgi:serine/threonine protein kinase, bacterial